MNEPTPVLLDFPGLGDIVVTDTGLGLVFGAAVAVILLVIVFGNRSAAYKAGHRAGYDQKALEDYDTDPEPDPAQEEPDGPDRSFFPGDAAREILAEDMSHTRIGGQACGWCLFFGEGARVGWEVLRGGLGRGSKTPRRALETMDWWLLHSQSDEHDLPESNDFFDRLF